MCQRGVAEIAYCLYSEKEKIYQKHEAHERGEIKLTDDEIQEMAIRMLMIKDAE